MWTEYSTIDCSPITAHFLNSFTVPCSFQSTAFLYAHKFLLWFKTLRDVWKSYLGNSFGYFCTVSWASLAIFIQNVTTDILFLRDQLYFNMQENNAQIRDFIYSLPYMMIPWNFWSNKTIHITDPGSKNVLYKPMRNYNRSIKNKGLANDIF